MSAKKNVWLVSTMVAGFALVAASGCQLPGKGDSQDVGLSAPFSMQGTWVGACHSASQDNSAYKIEKLTVQGSNFTHEEDDYSDAQCQTSTGNQILTGAFVDEGASPSVAGAEDVDFAIAEVIATGSGAQNGPSAGMTYYALVQVQGNQLMMGQDEGSNNGSSPNLRAIQIDTSNPLTKQ